MSIKHVRTTSFNELWAVRMKYTIRGFLARVLPCNRIIWCGRAKALSYISLTFDDGPNPRITPHLLDMLNELEVKATFFVIGNKVSGNLHLLEAMKQGGHQIGSHSFAHTNLNTMQTWEILEDIEKADECLMSHVGPVTLFRPPYGDFRWRHLPLIWKYRKTVALWSIDSRDFEVNSAQAILANINVDRLQGGDVLLFHELHHHTIDAIRELVPRIRKRGFEFTIMDRIVRFGAK